MYRIVKKRELNPTMVYLSIDAPFVAKKAKAGQFIIVIPDEGGERIPLTVADYDRKKGTVGIIFQIVGVTTLKLAHKNEGDEVFAFVGPLGKPTAVEGKKNVIIVGGGAGCAIALPVARGYHEAGAKVTSIVGFRNKELVILEDEFKEVSDIYVPVSDDGTYGRKGVVTLPLDEILASDKTVDMVMAIGPIIMMKFVVKTCQKYNIPCTVSMNPIMIDGTGMCGCCRLSVGGQTKFACVDGPDFNGYDVDFDSAMDRNTMYKPFERHAYEETCNLFKKEVK
ncbi:MAG: sulfide/dihydroorotate dehydrogenase-like FAD/NAD-binding protein [Bacilli bacterium]